MIGLQGSWDSGYAIENYNQPDGGRTLLGEAIYRYQYRKQWYLVDSLARWAQAFLETIPDLRQSDLIVPVPSSRLLTDYDPASLLVDWISQLSGIPRMNGVLARQGLISEYSERPRDSEGHMRTSQDKIVVGKRILLVDGIFCSGSTLEAACKALREGGASEVRALVFARIERGQVDQPGIHL